MRKDAYWPFKYPFRWEDNVMLNAIQLDDLNSVVLPRWMNQGRT
jgi:hypothetical protein